MGVQRNSMETQQSGHAPRFGPEIKTEEVVPNMAGESQMRDHPEGGELDPAEGVCRWCKKNFPFVLSCIGKRTREGCDHGSKVGTVHSG